MAGATSIIFCRIICSALEWNIAQKTAVRECVAQSEAAKDYERRLVGMELGEMGG